MRMAEKEKKGIGKVGMIVVIQSVVLLYSLVSMLTKIAGGVMKESGLFSVQFILLFAAMVLCMGIYALVWQVVLKRFDLSQAYVHKSMTLLWSLLWAVLIFHEQVRWNNIVGIAVVILGIILVTKDE